MINTNAQLPQLDIIGSSAVGVSSPIRSALKTIFTIIAIPLAGLAAIFSCFIALNIACRMKNMIRLSAEELKDFKEFIEKERIDMENDVDSQIMPFKGGKFAINSPELFSAYVKYLVKTSTDHELKDIPSEDIVIFTHSSEYKEDAPIGCEKDLSFLVELAKETGKPIPGLSNSVACRNIYSSFTMPSDVPSKMVNQEVCLLDKSAIIDCIKTDAAKKLKKNVEVLDVSGSSHKREIWNYTSRKMRPIESKEYMFNDQNFIAIPAGRAQEYDRISTEYKKSLMTESGECDE